MDGIPPTKSPNLSVVASVGSPKNGREVVGAVGTSQPTATVMGRIPAQEPGPGDSERIDVFEIFGWEHFT